MVSVVLPFDLSRLSSAASDTSSLPVVLAAFGGTLLAYKLLFPSTPAHERYAAAHGLTGIKPAMRLKQSSALLGDVVEIQKNALRFNDWVLEKTVECGEKPWLRVVPSLADMVIISTPELVEDVTKTQNDVFGKGPQTRGVFHDLIGDSYFAQDGDSWFHQRKTSSKFFSTRMFRDVATKMINKHAEQLFAVLQNAQDSHEEVNLSKLFHQFTLQAISELAFGLKMQLVGSKDDHPLDKALDDAFPQILRRVQIPKWIWRLQRFLNIGEERKYKDITDTIRKHVAEMVTQSLAQSREGGPRKEAATMVELFIHAMEDGEGEFSPELLRDIAIMFTIAGRDTTADTINWMFLMLSKNPDVEEKVRAELWDKVPDLMSGKVSHLEMEDTQHLDYMEAVIKETLRMYPVVPLSMRQAYRDTVLVDGTFIPAGCSVGISPYAMGRLTSVWGENALEFKPERFINEATGKLLVVPSYKFFSFHAGPRVCIGMNLAMLEMKLVISVLLSRFRLDVAPNDGSYKFSASMPLKNPLMVRVRPAKAPIQ